MKTEKRVNHENPATWEKAAYRDYRLESNTAVTHRLALISLLACLAFLIQHILFPSTVPLQVENTRLFYIAIFTAAAAISAADLILSRGPERNHRGIRRVMPRLFSISFVLTLTLLSLLDSQQGTHSSPFILGIMVFAAGYKEERPFRYGVVMAAFLLLLSGHWLLWGPPILDDLFMLISAILFSLWISGSLLALHKTGFYARQELDRKNRVLTKLTSTDPLTGILNRRSMMGSLKIQWDLFQRYGNQFSLLLMDIDFFKSVNDTHGHTVGDHVLREMAQMISRLLRTSDTFARYGGEEFLIILPHTDLNAAGEAAERIREKVEAARFTEKALRITASFGAAAMTTEVPTIEALLNRSDKALYLSKQQGRNQVTLFTAPPSSAAAQ